MRRIRLTCPDCTTDPIGTEACRAAAPHNRFFYWDDTTTLSDLTRAGITLNMTSKGDSSWTRGGKLRACAIRGGAVERLLGYEISFRIDSSGVGAYDINRMPRGNLPAGYQGFHPTLDGARRAVRRSHAADVRR